MKTGKFKLAVVSLLLVCVLGICGCGSAKYEFNIATDHDFRNIDLGASPASVKSSETFTLSDEKALGEQTILMYKDVTVDGFKSNILYTINSSGTLSSASVYYMCDEKEVDAVYDALTAKCKELYGSTYLFSDSESIHWKLDGKFVCILKSKTKVIYNVCTEASYYAQD